MLSNLDARRCGTLCFCVIFRGDISVADDDDDDVVNRFVHCDENNEELAVNRLFTLGRFLANRLASIVINWWIDFLFFCPIGEVLRVA